MNTLARRSLLLVIASGLLALAGCASVPLASSEQDTAAKSFSAQPGQARIYLYRNETFGAAVKMPVSFNGQTVGQTAANTYFFWDVAPGNYSIASLTENTPTIEVNAQADNVYYVWQEVKMGALQARSALHLVDEAKGRKGVQECKLAQAQSF